MNQKIKLIPLLLFSAFATQAAKDVKVMQYLHAGPITVNKPILTDSLNVDGKPFEAKKPGQVDYPVRPCPRQCSRYRRRIPPD